MSLKMYLLLDPEGKDILPEGIDIEDNNYFIEMDSFGNPLTLCYDLMGNNYEDSKEFYN